MRPLRLLLFTVALALPAQGWSQDIGVFADAEGTNPEICVALGVPVRVYMVFRQTDSPGIAGFELRVTGLPDSWIWIDDGCGPILCPPMDWFGSGGYGAWPECQMGDRVVLRSFLIVAFDVQDDIALEIAAHVPPSNPALDCPVVACCDAPIYTLECAAGLRTTIRQTGCPVGVQQASWSTIKRLYESP